MSLFTQISHVNHRAGEIAILGVFSLRHPGLTLPLLLYSHMHMHLHIYAEYILTQWIKTSEDFLRKICTSHFIVRVRKGLLRVLLWEGVGDWTKRAIYWPPTLMAISIVSFSFSRAAQPEAQRPTLLGAGFLYHILSLTSLVPQLSDFLSSPSYIIVQLPAQLPIQSLEWHIWSSSSGIKCHTVQRSLSSGASVYECIMGFYLVPFRQPNPPTRFLSITGHWNVSLPSGASLWNGMFGWVEGQNTTLTHSHDWTNLRTAKNVSRGSSLVYHFTGYFPSLSF